MRRGDLWAQAKQQMDVALKDITPADEVGLYLFDRQLRPALTMGEWNQTDPSHRMAILKSRLAEATPGWSGTRLGDCIAAAADLASENNSANPDDRKKFRQVILITDMQEGGRVEALQGHEWPKEVGMRALTVSDPEPGNASLQWVKNTAEVVGAASTAPAAAGTAAPIAQADGTLRVSVTNQSDSKHEQFKLQWANSTGPLPVPAVDVYVTPGRTQIVKVPLPPEPVAATTMPVETPATQGGPLAAATASAPAAVAVPHIGGAADRLILTGDDCDFDNTLYLVPPHTETVRVLYVGEDPPTDVNALRYYLQSALFDTPSRKMEFIGKKATDALSDEDTAGIRLAVVATVPSDDTISRLRRYVEEGGELLWVGKDVETMQRAGVLLGRELEVTEGVNGGAAGAETGVAGAGQSGGGAAGYSLISHVELGHPLFAPFADARFADFSKIHFWKHRAVKWDHPGGAQEPDVLATFDNGDPFLFEQSVGKGKVRVMTSGWQPGDSQFALSSKFLPLLDGMVKRKDAIVIGAQYTVDEAIPLPVGAGGAVGGQVTAPDGVVTQVGAATVFSGADQPGVYQLKLASGVEGQFAVNLSPDESRTIEVPAQEMEQWGVIFTSPEQIAAAADQQRKLLSNELENRQKSWRWLLLGVLGLLAIETALAGRLSRSALPERAAA
jgi:hypothetical protein